MPIDDNLREYATSRQAQYMDLIAKHGSIANAAAQEGLGAESIARSIRRLKAAAARAGYAPGHFNQGTAPGYAMGKVTIQRNADGDIERTWERQSPDQEKFLAFIQESIEAAKGEITPATPIPAPSITLANLATLYTFTDYHLGALCWHKEGGADWDVGIAESTGVAAMRQMVSSSPASETAIVNIQGDFLHSDGLAAVTPTHGHILDADSRFGKVVKVAIRLIRQLVSLALQKHKSVTLIVCEGNHDLASSLWLRNLFAALYEDEKRIAVHDSELPYYAIEWGKVMLGFHHGHLRKNDSLPVLFAAQFREAWGRCPKVYIHCGHRHHIEIKEHPGAIVVQHPTIAARDAHASRGGWWSERAIKAITYHKEFGEVGTITVSPEMLEGM